MFVRASFPRSVVLLLLPVLVVIAGCHETGDIQVKQLSFNGVHAFPDSDLTRILATRKSGWLPWSPKHYFDRKEFDADIARIHAYYVDHGYPDQRVTGLDVNLSSDRKSVKLRIDIAEGQPVTVEAVRFENFQPLPETVRSQLKTVPLVAGAPRDRDKVRSTRDLAARLLRNNGYPIGYVDAGERPGDAPNSVIVTFRADTGPALAFGDVTIDGLENVDRNIILRQLNFRPGDQYRESRLLWTQRRISALPIFDLVNITPRVEEVKAGRVPIRVTVAESLPRRLTVGIGYGTEERARGRIEWTHNNFMGGARQATFSARASFLDQGVSITLVQPRIRRTGLTFSFTGLAERTRQLSYDWESYGGRVSATYRLDRSRPNIVGTGAGRGQHYDFTAGYIHEYQRYGIAEDSLNDLSRRDERIALGLDPITGRAAGTLAALDFDIQRVDVNNLVQPTRGLVTSLHVEHAAPWLLGTYKFTEVMADARGYVPIGTSVLAARAQVGTVAASDLTTIPFSHRYFLGGATTLRGWGRYQVSPLDQNGLPIGGRTLVYLSTEFRFPIRGKIAAVGFVDAGNVGRSDFSSSQSPLRFDVGPGLRYQTPVGAIRADLGFQLNPIPGLIVNGKPETRHWRVHFSIGQTF